MSLGQFEEARLFTTNAERERWETQATLFSVIVSLDFLERAYVRGSVPETEYTPACSKMLTQCKTLLNLITSEQQSADRRPGAPPPITSVEDFMKHYRMDHPGALHRLTVGVPATVEHASAGQTNSADQAKWVAQMTQAWITLMDALKLRMHAKDQLHPLLSELMSTWARSETQEDSEGRGRMLHWLITLNQMKVSDELSEEQARQMRYEVDLAYTAWFHSLQSS